MPRRFQNKELSWLSFNERLLQEAQDSSVPLLERLRFLGIFSANLDEFFRVRVATLKRLRTLGKRGPDVSGIAPRDVLKEIHGRALRLQDEFEHIYEGLTAELAKQRIYIKNETQLTQKQSEFVRDYFAQKVRPTLIPLMLEQSRAKQTLRDHTLYLAVILHRKSGPTHALIEIPTKVLSRFLTLPKEDGEHALILLDDVIRHNLLDVFNTLEVRDATAYTLKVTRDAEIDLEEDWSEGVAQKLARGLEKRKWGRPVRLVYDETMPASTIEYLLRKLKISKREADLIPGGRYHNFKDFIRFPSVGGKRLMYPEMKPSVHPALAQNPSVFKAIETRDILLHFPYQSFGAVLDLLREAAIDPSVRAISITLYRVAPHSNIINALINAARNGKKVLVALELQARFDEEANLQWSARLQREGCRVVHGVPGSKVHAKLLLIERVVSRSAAFYAYVGTGNFNEVTAQIYADHGLLTWDKRITREIRQVFAFLCNPYSRTSFKHLLVSPFSTRERLIEMINQEARNAKNGLAAWISIKLNNLTDEALVRALYKASQAGVQVQLSVRGMFGLQAGVAGLSENIQAHGLIDRFLEHSRVFIFCAGGRNETFIASADWMPRNLDNRLEVTCPIYDESLKAELFEYLQVHQQDNVKNRSLLVGHANERPSLHGEKRRAQQQLLEKFGCLPLAQSLMPPAGNDAAPASRRGAQ